MIEISSTLKISLRALRVNKMRSALTMLGIIIGVGAVITMLAVGNGARSKIKTDIASLGSNMIMVMPGSSSAGGIRMGMGTQSTLSVSDAEAIRRDISEVTHVAPRVGISAQLVNGNQNWSTAVNGSTPDIFSIQDWELDSGRFLNEEDEKAAAKVCMLGQTVTTELFGDVDPIGKTIRIKNIPFTVVGILAGKGQGMGRDQDDTVYVPFTAAQQQLCRSAFPGSVNLIMLKAADDKQIPRAVSKITSLLQQRHRIQPGKDNDFSVRDTAQMMETANSIGRTLTILLGAIASVSLLVGGIGIMNIMLVSVTERTREIGIRMAVGAKTRDIRLQFIIEAIMLSLLGGIAGILFGVVMVFVIAQFANWPPVISLPSVALSITFSGLVGVGFGFYPAYKASLLNPIDALRYE